MVEVRTVHTAWLGAEERAAIRWLLEAAFPEDFTDADYEHTLGGLHALVWEGPHLIGHGSVVMRRLHHDGRALRCGYVEGVAVREDRRRRGHGATVMARLEQAIRGAYEIGALGASDAGAAFYGSRGWQLWTGTSSVMAPGGIERTPEEDGSIYVLPGSAELTATGDLACDWREGSAW